jgi:hypothetical protein
MKLGWYCEMQPGRSITEKEREREREKKKKRLKHEK